jgi:hypothetical protein
MKIVCYTYGECPYKIKGIFEMSFLTKNAPERGKNDQKMPAFRG